jgi:hypothetical protein
MRARGVGACEKSITATGKRRRREREREEG